MGCVMRFQQYNPKLKELARKLRNNSTKAEIRLWRYLRGKQVRGLDFHRQKPLGDFIADFYCPEIKLVIEVDGYTHRFQDTIRKDKGKEDYLKKCDIVVMRFKDDEVMNDIKSVISRIEQFGSESQNRARRESSNTPLVPLSERGE